MNEIPLITRIVVKNYRSLLDVDVALTPLTVFVGKNGAGKSNLIEVLRFVRDALTSGLQEAIMMRGGIRALRCWFADASEHVSIHLHIDGTSWSGEYGFAFGNRSADECELKSEQLSITDEHHQKRFFKVVDGQLVKASHGRLTGPVSTESFYLSQFKAPCAKAVRDFLTNMSFYDLPPAYMRKPQKLFPPFPLLETGENLASTLREMQKRSQDYLITEALEVVADGLDGYLIEQTKDQLITMLHYTFQNGRPFTLSSRLSDEADGTIRMLAILTALYQERFPSLLAIEEPEKELYLDGLALCSEVFQEAAWRYQVMLTTHSPDLINYFPADTIRVVEKENGTTKVGPISDHQYKSMAENLFLAGGLMRIQGLEAKIGA